jgi:hypothetical protein
MKLNGAARSEHAEWAVLINALVEIRRNGHVVRTGFVDNVMPDSSAIWIAADANDRRQIYAASEGYEVWATPQELTGALRYRMTTHEIFKANPARNGE